MYLNTYNFDTKLNSLSQYKYLSSKETLRVDNNALPAEAELLPSDGQWACAPSSGGFGLEDGIGMEETEPRTGRAAPVDGTADPK